MDTGYLIDKVVGSGTFGMVYLVLYNIKTKIRHKRKTPIRKLL